MLSFYCKVFVLTTVFLSSVKNGNAETQIQNIAPECKDKKGVPIPKCLPVDRLIEGVHRFGDSGLGKDPKNLPSWFNPQLAKKGQEFARDKLHGVVYGQLLSLILLLAQTSIRRVLYYTQASHTVDKAAKRYMATILQVVLWYDADITDRNSSLYKSIYRVRSIHSSMGSRVQEDSPDFASNQMVFPKNSSLFYPLPQDPPASIQSKADLKNYDDLWAAFKQDLKVAASNKTVTKRIPLKRGLDKSVLKKATDDTFYFNQYDMAITHFSFLGIIVLMPERIYIPQTTEEELKAFIHLWTILGHLVGIEDEYNICLNKDLDSCRRYCRKILDQEMLPRLFNLDDEGYVMFKALILSIPLIQPAASVNTVLIALLEDITGIECPNLMTSQPIGTWLSRQAKNNIIRSSVDAEYYRKFAIAMARYDFSNGSKKYYGFGTDSMNTIAEKAYYGS